MFGSLSLNDLPDVCGAFAYTVFEIVHFRVGAILRCLTILKRDAILCSCLYLDCNDGFSRHEIVCRRERVF
jgi:hypothetical protein